MGGVGCGGPPGGQAGRVRQQQSRWRALQIVAGSLEPGGCGQLYREQRCDAVGGEAEHLGWGRMDVALKTDLF